MKIKKLVISLILFCNLAHAASEEKQMVWINECITNTPNYISYARGVEYCGCVTRKLMDRFTEKQIDKFSEEDIAKNKLLSEIVEIDKSLGNTIAPASGEQILLAAAFRKSTPPVWKVLIVN